MLNTSQFINLLLRSLTLLSKFLLVIFLAKYLEPSEVGLYGLISVTLSFALYFVGFEFYTYTTREIINKQELCGWFIKNHIVFLFFVYLLFMPMLLFIFIKGLLPWWTALWFFLLLILEHISQEANRVLIATSRQLAASIVLFLRSGLWAWIVIGLMFYNPDVRALETVLYYWVIGGATAIFLSGWYLINQNIKGWSKPVNWNWIRDGIYTALPFLLSALSLRAILTVDRYWVELLLGLDVLGVYVLFIGLATALISFLDAGVFVYIYPTLIFAYGKGDTDLFRKVMKRLCVNSLWIIIIFIISAYWALPYIVSFINKAVYTEYQWMFPWILLSIVLWAIGMIPQFALYAQGKDKHVIYSYIFGLIVFVVSAYIISKFVKDYAVLGGLCLSFGLMFVWKVLIYYMHTPKEYLFGTYYR